MCRLDKKDLTIGTWISSGVAESFAFANENRRNTSETRRERASKVRKYVPMRKSPTEQEILVSPALRSSVY